MIITTEIKRKDGTSLIGDKLVKVEYLLRQSELTVNLKLYANDKAFKEGFSPITNVIGIPLRMYIELTEDEIELISEESVEYFVSRELEQLLGKGAVKL